MRIFIFGNINSGKSYYASKLKGGQFTDYPVLSIDSFRIKYGDCTYEKEFLAQEKFVEEVYNNKDCIVECTGLGPLGHQLYEKHSYKDDIILYINTPIRTCIDRLNTKDFSRIPYPPVEEQMVDTITRCGQEFDNFELEKLWSNKVLGIFAIKTYDDLNNVPFDCLILFSNAVRLLYINTHIKTIFPYGSLARNEMNFYSDVDCFLVTDLKVEEIIEILSQISGIYSIDNVGNKIIIRDTKFVLIEFVILMKLSDGERYILGSLISNLSSISIKISLGDREYLDNLDNNLDKPIDSVNYLVSELRYFIGSMSKIIKQNDIYKYYFHFNIIVHDYIRITEILKGNISFNYLPKVDYQEYKELIEMDRSNLENHYVMLSQYVNILLKRVQGVFEV